MAADQGHELAQLMIGRFYYDGKGVPQSYTEAARWLSPLADRGWVSAQVILGDLYLRGQGVSQDYVTAHMWLNLAAAQGNDAAREARDLVAENMTIAEIAEAQRRALEWQPMPER